MNKSQSSSNLPPQKDLAIKLKNRLYQRGMSIEALPSLERSRPNTRSNQGSSAFLFDNISPPQSASSRNRPSSSRTSITGFVNTPALRPSSARKTPSASMMSRCATQPLRPGSAFMKSQFLVSNTDKDGPNSQRAVKWIDKFKGKPTQPVRPSASMKNLVFTETQEEEEQPTFTDLDHFVQSAISKETSPSEFLYLNPRLNSHPFDLEVVPVKKVSKKRYYTMSSNGVSLFLKGTPVEFTSLKDWLKDREYFHKLVKIGFFNKFRMWKSVNMWKKKIYRKRRQKNQARLSEKLFFVDKVYSDLLLNHKALCKELETYKFMSIPNNYELGSLPEFLEQQYKVIEDSNKATKEVYQKLRENMRECSSLIFDKIREQVIMDIATEKSFGKSSQRTLPKRVSQIYEKMGFPENMTYNHRCILRHECSRLLRFSYLLDFITCESLRNVYLTSVKEVLLKLYHQVSSTIQLNPPNDESVFNTSRIQKRRTKPFFKLELVLDDHPVSEELLVKCDGLSHPNLQMQVSDPTWTPKANYFKDLSKEWLCLMPSKQDFLEGILDLVNLGLSNLQEFERWSKHPDLEDYASALEEWDDKVTEHWKVPESLSLDLKPWLEKNPLYTKFVKKLDTILRKAFKCTEEHFEKFEDSLQEKWKNEEIDFEVLSSDYLENQIEVWEALFRLFKNQRLAMYEMPTKLDSGLFMVDTKVVKEQLIKSPKDCYELSEKILVNYIRKHTEQLRSWVINSSRSIVFKVSDVESFVTQRLNLDKINLEIEEKRKFLDTLSILFRLGTSLQLDLSKDDNATFTNIYQNMSILTSKMIQIESSTEENMKIFKKKLREQIPGFFSDLNTLFIKASNEKYLKLDQNPQEAIEELELLEKTASEFKAQGLSINKFQEVLEEPLTSFAKTEKLLKEIQLRKQLWQGYKDWTNYMDSLLLCKLSELDLKSLSSKVQDYTKLYKTSENFLPASSVTQKLKSMVDQVKESIPIINSLRAPLEEKHWQQIKHAVGFDFEVTENFRFLDLLNAAIEKHSEKIQSIAISARQEKELKGQLKAIQTLWEEMEIPIKFNREKEVHLLGNMEELMSTLDESIAKLSQIEGNRHVAPLREEVETWKDYLNCMQDAFEEWFQCQKTWLYLYAVFSAPDIKKKLPKVASTFDSVDKFFKSTMKRASTKNNALYLTVIEGRLVDQFKKQNKLLDSIQKHLDNYLEQKRAGFPRFYFISDNELIEILAKSSSPPAVQVHARKCFEAVHQLEFGSDPKSMDVLSIVSPEGEKLSFEGKVVKARGNVEEWLKNTQNAMYETLSRDFKYCRDTMHESSKENWLLGDHIAQAIYVVSQAAWSSETELTFLKLEEKPNALAEWYRKVIENLKFLIELLKLPIPKIKRDMIITLITSEVHNRDVIHLLVEEEVLFSSDFLWQQQLRYYWNEDSNIIIRQINAVLDYGYEYLGVMQRLVVTPLTERCWITITSAINLKLGANPSGPAGSGKTESTKDLAKGLGLYCISFNCSEMVTFAMTRKLFAGLAQQGAWSCLDEFNRIGIEVLSVIAQQLQVVRQGLLQSVSSFEFEGKTIKLKQGFGVFITMNPGYAGRTELPDNLKVLFRPVAMMVPDYSMICEIILFSIGFKKGNLISKKLVELYKLASDQLSKQSHYDFGMRALKSVLLLAGEVSKAQPDLEEEQLIIKSVKESNLPKLVGKDLELFEALVKDLFPCTTEPPNILEDLESQIKESMAQFNLQPLPNLLKKCLELYQTLQVRFGVMLIGPTNSGKSTSFKLLSSALSTENINYFQLNPKSISLSELYGHMNELTQEWNDGLASMIMKQAIEAPEKTWLVFDGPVSSDWIENMNTVLDDNKMLCLGNGERIKLRTDMRILFEVLDLKQATPATISRCGVVYFPQDCVTWKAYVDSWLSGVDESFHTALKELFELYSLVLKQVSKFREVVTTSQLQKCVNTCRILEKMLSCLPQTKRKVKDIAPSFVFATVWGLGGALESFFHDSFSGVVRHLFNQTTSLPLADTVYDYFLEHETIFKPWSQEVPEFKYDPSQSYFQLVVPTSHTQRFTYLLSNLKNTQMMFTGETGVGKSLMITTYLAHEKQKDLIETVELDFSARTSSLATQQTIETKLERKAVGVYSAPASRQLVVFVDDVNMPACEVYGAQPPVELLRQLVDAGGFYERNKYFWKSIKNFNLVCAAGPAGGGRNEMTPRFLRHFQVLNVTDPTQETLHKIFSSILGGFLEGFSDKVKKLVDPAVYSTIEIYQTVTKNLKPTPSKFHYVYNLRDVSKVFQGIMMARVVSTKEQLSKLWLHECLRVFQDRLVCEEDRNWLQDSLIETGRNHFEVAWKKEDLVPGTLVFSNLTSNYQEVKDKEKLELFLKNKIDEYNIKNKQKLEIAIFDQVLIHVLRITRVLSQPKGNLMLIGVGGSGKQSLTKLAAAILDYSVFSIYLKKDYGLESFREDLKQLLWKSGVEGVPQVFVLNDNTIVQESFLEDINSLLNTGEVSNLFTNEETDQVVEALREEVVVTLKLPDSKEVIHETFINKIKENLHLVMCMSPVGDALRVRCRMFPSLVNCTTIDWFDKWPDTALLAVAESKLSRIPLENSQEAITQLAVEFHLSVQRTSNKFFEELNRKTYFTPKNYFDLFSLYSKKLQETKEKFFFQKEKLSSGIQKLNETKELVNQLQSKIQEMMPDLEIQKQKSEEYYEEVQKQTQATQEIERVVEQEAEFVRLQAQECEVKAKEAEKELELTKPALEAADSAVSVLEKKKKDIVEFKNYLKPPENVKLVMEAVCVLLGEQTDWNHALAILGNMNFIQRLLSYNKEEITPTLMAKLRKYINRPNFTPEQVGKSSDAAKSLCVWVISMYQFAEVYQQVKPKKEKVQLMRNRLQADTQKLEEKQEELEQVQNNVAKLKKDSEDTQNKVNQLEEEIKLSRERLKRAELLLDLLSEEGLRWKSTLSEMEQVESFIEGNVFVACGFLCYLGPFTGHYRKETLRKWLRSASQLGLKYSSEFQLKEVLTTPSKIRDWQINGLPQDLFSTENAIITLESIKTPLLIDPQSLGNKWIKNLECSEISVIKLSLIPSQKETTNLLRTLEACIANGKPLLIENVSEIIDPLLAPAISQQTYTNENSEVVLKLGDSEVTWDPGFRMYLTTKLANPHYLPETAVNLSIVNFTVTFSGLEEQMLVDVVKLQNPELETQRDQLVLNIAQDKSMLEQTQDHILELMAESSGYVLDNLSLISALEKSKVTYNTINKRVKTSSEVQKQITQSRQVYLELAHRGAVLYFVVNDLSRIDPMYQYSFWYIKTLFVSAIEQSSQVEIPQLVEVVTDSVYQNVCRSLFEAHKLLFGFLITIGIKKHSGSLEEKTWEFFIRGPGVLEDLPESPDFLSSSQWQFACSVSSSLPELKDLCSDIESNPQSWSNYLVTSDPLNNPTAYISNFSPAALSYLLLVRIFRIDKLNDSIREFIVQNLGKKFTESPPTSIEEVFATSNKNTPVVFVLSQGADPTQALYEYVSEKEQKFVNISLGQGQGPKAQEAIEKAKSSGSWVLLQNCHLAVSFMQTLENTVESITEDKTTHKDFRLILTSMPSKDFPSLVLQNSAKLTTEPPKGIKAGLQKLYCNYQEDSGYWGQMFFALSFFHTLASERRKFGHLGFNNFYEFNETDHETSCKVLKLMLEENEGIPWEALIFMTGHINYGGRVTDDWDRLCLVTMLKMCYSPDIFEEECFFTEDGTYRVPQTGFVEYLNSLPQTDPPEVFGLHENANITYQTQESQRTLKAILEVQPKLSSSSAKNSDSTLLELTKSLLHKLPENLNTDRGHPELFVKAEYGLIPSLSTVLLQEVDKYNILLSQVRNSLKQLRKAIKGQVLMSDQLDKTYNQLLNSEVPWVWKKVAYPSLKSLGSWMQNLKERVEFINNWLTKGTPEVYWLPGFFFPHSFITGVLQTHSRKYKVPIDDLNFKFEVLENYQERHDGVCVEGLFLDGARWEHNQLAELQPAQIYCKMPAVHFLPTKEEPDKEFKYECPVYRTSERAGQLSSTGHSTNFILSINLDTEEPPEHWTLRGTALICELSN